MSPAEVLCALQRTTQGIADSAQHGSPPFFFVSPLLKAGKTVKLWMSRFPVLTPKSKIDDFPIGEHDRGFRMSYSTLSGAQPIFRSIRGQVCVSHFWPISVILGEVLSPLPDLSSQPPVTDPPVEKDFEAMSNDPGSFVRSCPPNKTKP